MNRANRISGLFWLVFAVIASVESYRMGMGTLHRPGPGFLFFWAGILLAILSLILLVRSAIPSQAERAGGTILGGQGIGKIALVLLALFLYVLLIETLGFIVVTLLLFLFLLGVVEKKGGLFTIITSLCVTAAAYLIFETVLHSQLPKGLLGG